MSNLIEYIEEMFLSVINKKKVDFLNGLTVIAKKPQKRSKRWGISPIVKSIVTKTY